MSHFPCVGSNKRVAHHTSAAACESRESRRWHWSVWKPKTKKSYNVGSKSSKCCINWSIQILQTWLIWMSWAISWCPEKTMGIGYPNWWPFQQRDKCGFNADFELPNLQTSPWVPWVSQGYTFHRLRAVGHPWSSPSHEISIIETPRSRRWTFWLAQSWRWWFWATTMAPPWTWPFEGPMLGWTSHNLSFEIGGWKWKWNSTWTH